MNTNVILPSVAMLADEFAQWDGTMALEAAQTIRADASASATAITITICGMEVT